MKPFIKRLKEADIINRIQNKFFIKIGLFYSSEFPEEVAIREIEPLYYKKQVDINDARLLEEYAIKHRGKEHYSKNILPRLKNNDRFKGFAIIDREENEVAYLCWIDFKKATIPEIDYCKSLRDREAFFLDDHCVKHHQRKGLHNTMFNERLLYCKKKGIKEVFIAIYLNNFKALNNLKKHNFLFIRTFTHITIFNFK